VKRPIALIGGAILLLALVVAGLLSARSSTTQGPSGPAKPEPGPSLSSARAQLAGAPPPLAALHDQSARLLGGGDAAFAARLKALHGYPVVVNKWGSWCGPCRSEFPAFQRASARYGKKVAFLGVDGEDHAPAARRFLRQFPVAYPSYVDSKLAIARRLKAVQAFPSTVFYDSKGGVAYIKQGSYADEHALAADIRRYAR
jgi:thiol-disulfide isomerase/thioredoxin